MDDAELHTLYCDACNCDVCHPESGMQDASSCRCGRDFSIDVQPLSSDETGIGDEGALADSR